MKKKMGRPSKLTPEVTEEFIRSLRAGNYVETAASYAGISKVSVYAWLKRGAREKKGEYTDFLNAVKKAQSVSEVLAVAQITAAAKKQWQAAAWRLERMYPARWGQRVRLTVEQEQSAFLDRLERALPSDIFQQVLAAGITEVEEDPPAPETDSTSEG